MRETILVLSLFILPALYLCGFFFAFRLILRSTEATATKGLLILVLIVVFVVVSLATLGMLMMMAGGYNH